MADIPLRFLGRSEVIAAGGGDIAAAVADVRAVFALLRRGGADMPAETSVALGEVPDPLARAYALPARVGGAYQAVGIKWTAHRPPLDDGVPAIVGLTLVNDLATGSPLGIVESALLTVARTAAVTALALAQLAPVALRRVAVLGAGAQARGHLAMLAALHPALDEVVLWNRTAGRAAALQSAFAADFPRISVAPSVAAAVAGADAVLSCTAAAAPFLPDDVVAPGRLVAQIGVHEVPFAAIDRADAVVVDRWGPFAATSAKSLFQMHRAGQFAEARVAANLGDALATGWRPPAGGAVYFSSFGLNVFDVALAARVLRSAAARGIGTALSLSGTPAGDWPWR